MSIFNKIAGYGSINNNIEHQISDYLLDDENVIMAFTFVRDSVVLTNYGIYTLDVQGVSGKKVEVMADSVSSKETIRLSKSDYRGF